MEAVYKPMLFGVLGYLPVCRLKGYQCLQKVVLGAIIQSRISINLIKINYFVEILNLVCFLSYFGHVYVVDNFGFAGYLLLNLILIDYLYLEFGILTYYCIFQKSLAVSLFSDLLLILSLFVIVW